MTITATSVLMAFAVVFLALAAFNIASPRWLTWFPAGMCLWAISLFVSVSA